MIDAVVAESVTLAYRLAHRDVVAVAGATFTIPRGAITAIIGPNGSGKSTLLAAIAGLHPLRDGKLVVLGSSPALARPRVAYVLQATKVNEALPVTVGEVVAMGRFARLGLLGRPGTTDRRTVAEAMARMSLEGIATRHLDEISAGQRQRVFVAQGLAQDHDVLLLDEPITGLDLVSAESIGEAIRQEKMLGCTVVVTTHDLAEAASADHVLLMANRLVAAGPPDQALTRDHLTEAYGTSVVSIGEGFLIDDAAHRHGVLRHLHRERGHQHRTD